MANVAGAGNSILTPCNVRPSRLKRVYWKDRNDWENTEIIYLKGDKQSSGYLQLQLNSCTAAATTAGTGAVQTQLTTMLQLGPGLFWCITIFFKSFDVWLCNVLVLCYNFFFQLLYYRKRGSASYIVREWLLWEGERERERETPVTSFDITLKSRVIMHMITSTARRPNASTRSEPVECSCIRQGAWCLSARAAGNGGVIYEWR